MVSLLQRWSSLWLTLLVGTLTGLAIAVTSFDLLGEAEGVRQRAVESRLALAAALAAKIATPEVMNPAVNEPSSALPRATRGAPPSGLTAEERHAEAIAALSSLYDEIRATGELHRLTLVDRKLHPLVDRPDPQSPAQPVAVLLRACDTAAVLSGQRVVGAPAGTGTTAFQAACAPVMSAEGDVMGLVVAAAPASWLPQREAQAPRSRALVIGLGSVVALVVILGIRTILLPLKRVAETAARMALGERGVRVQNSGIPDLDPLAAALNELASAVEAREDEVRARLAGMTQLTGLVAHEVRNPLQSLSLLCALARTETNPAERDLLLNSIEQEIHALEGVVQRFLRSSGPLQISRAASDLVETTRRATVVAAPQARARNVEMETRLPPKLPMSMDASLVRRAIENLLLNAVEFAAQEKAGHVLVVLDKRGRDAILTVDDNGPGVPAAERDRIFKAYYSSKAGGTGLGLALVKQVFEAHGGTIRCEESPLGGARFMATLPIDESLEVPFAR